VSERGWIIVGLLAALTAGTGYFIMKPRGIRNNNPGNIRRSSDAWLGLSQTQSDPDYFQFTDMLYGIRAAGKLVRNYATRYGINTIHEIITRWAPQHENPTDKYIDNVAAVVGVNPTSTIDLNDAATLERLLLGIFNQENGRGRVSLEDIKRGIALI
jgi:hypothetical protein